MAGCGGVVCSPLAAYPHFSHLRLSVDKRLLEVFLHGNVERGGAELGSASGVEDGGDGAGADEVVRVPCAGLEAAGASLGLSGRTTHQLRLERRVCRRHQRLARLRHPRDVGAARVHVRRVSPAQVAAHQRLDARRHGAEERGVDGVVARRERVGETQSPTVATVGPLDRLRLTVQVRQVGPVAVAAPATLNGHGGCVVARSHGLAIAATHIQKVTAAVRTTVDPTREHGDRFVLWCFAGAVIAPLSVCLCPTDRAHWKYRCMMASCRPRIRDRYSALMTASTDGTGDATG